MDGSNEGMGTNTEKAGGYTDVRVFTITQVKSSSGSTFG